MANTANNANRFNARDYLIAAIRDANKGAALGRQAGNKRGGAYVSLTRAAIVAGSAETFTKACDALWNDIRTNKDGIAKDTGCKLAKNSGKGKNKGKPPVYQVPGSCSTAKSVLLAGFKCGAEFGTIEEPAKFGAIREHVNEAKAAEEVASLEGDALVRHNIVQVLGRLSVNLVEQSTWTGQALADTLGVLTALADSTETKADDNDGQSVSPVATVVAAIEDAKPAKRASRRKAA
jgi:hypothetical protein